MDKNDFTQFRDHHITNSVHVYTVLCILRNMKAELGFEAMLEYLDKYLALIDENNPKLNLAVKKALSQISLERLYKDVMKN